MNFKLGDRVRFDRELVKVGAGGFLEPDELWEEIKLEEPLTGVFCGKRNIVRYAMQDDEWQLYNREYQQVCLVATDLRGFHRVPEEWLDPVSNKKRF